MLLTGSKEHEVEFVEDKTSPEAIRKVIEEQTGFDAEIVRVE